MELPKTTQERIKTDAEKAYPISWQYQERIGYIAGATAEAELSESIRLQLGAQDANVEILLQQKKELNERAQKLVGDVSRIREIIKGLTAAETHRFPTLQMLDKELEQALAEWKGAEKEVNDPCPHCGKELSRDRNLCCRECGKEVGDELP